ncbi:hypothetical protein D047_3009A, partial [Vibrio parahaemolyticus VPTS-2010_2]
MFPPPP